MLLQFISVKNIRGLYVWVGDSVSFTWCFSPCHSSCRNSQHSLSGLHSVLIMFWNMNYFVLDWNLLVLFNIILDTKAGYKMFTCVHSRAVLWKEVLAIRLQEGRKNGTERVWERKSDTQIITLVFHSNHLKICARKTFIKGIHSCKKKRFRIKLFLNCQTILKWCDVQL
jgi:hypothetical protein